MKLCRKCGRKLPLSAFNSDAHQFDGKACYCRSCVNERARKYDEIKKQGRIPTLQRYTTEQLLDEIKFRLYEH
jgi:hypothetical protein